MKLSAISILFFAAAAAAAPEETKTLLQVAEEDGFTVPVPAPEIEHNFIRGLGPSCGPGQDFEKCESNCKAENGKGPCKCIPGKAGDCKKCCRKKCNGASTEGDCPQ